MQCSNASNDSPPSRGNGDEEKTPTTTTVLEPKAGRFPSLADLKENVFQPLIQMYWSCVVKLQYFQNLHEHKLHKHHELFIRFLNNKCSKSGPSLVHSGPTGVDVSQENLGPPLDDIDQRLNAQPASLALPVLLVQEERLQELHPQL